MPFTKLTKMILYPLVNDPATVEGLTNDRMAWLQDSVSAGKTDGVSTKADALTWSRVWTDSAAASEWIAFIEPLFVKYNMDVNFAIMDVPAEPTPMLYTKSTIMQWATHLNSSDFNQMSNEVDQWTRDAMIAGKTDGLLYTLGELTFKRVWADQAAAEEWAAFITQTATKYSTSVTVTELSNLPVESELSL